VLDYASGLIIPQNPGLRRALGACTVLAMNPDNTPRYVAYSHPLYYTLRTIDRVLGWCVFDRELSAYHAVNMSEKKAQAIADSLNAEAEKIQAEHSERVKANLLAENSNLRLELAEARSDLAEKTDAYNNLRADYQDLRDELAQTRNSSSRKSLIKALRLIQSELENQP
jgi:hypothetical protein